MPRKGIEIERSSSVRMDRWEKPTLAELVLPHALDPVRGSALLPRRTFYADFAPPLSVPVFCLAFAVPIDGRDYDVEIALTPAWPGCPPDAPRVHLDRTREDGLSLIPWRRRVYAEERLFYFEVRWQAETGTTRRIDFPAAMPRATVDTHMRAARTVLYEAARRFGGRPPDIEDKATFWDLYWKAYQKVLAHKRGESTTRPSKTEVASEMLMTVKTLRRYRKRYNLPWPPGPPP